MNESTINFDVICMSYLFQYNKIHVDLLVFIVTGHIYMDSHCGTYAYVNKAIR